MVATGRLQVAEVLEDARCVNGIRPFGRTVKFVETVEVAGVREFHEELAVTVKVV